VNSPEDRKIEIETGLAGDGSFDRRTRLRPGHRPEEINNISSRLYHEAHRIGIGSFVEPFHSRSPRRPHPGREQCGQGATFSFVLPSETLMTELKPRVFVIDDDASVLKSLSDSCAHRDLKRRSSIAPNSSWNGKITRESGA